MRQMHRTIFAAAGSLLISTPFCYAQIPAPAAPPTSQVSVSPIQAREAGHALKQIMAIQQSYRAQMKSPASPRQQYTQQQKAVAEETRAIRQQGLSVAQYSQVITVARTNPQVRQEILAAASLGQK